MSANVFGLVDTGPGPGLSCEPDGGADGFLGTEMDVMAWSELIGTGNINIDFLFSPVNFPNNFFSWRPSLQIAGLVADASSSSPRRARMTSPTPGSPGRRPAAA